MSYIKIYRDELDNTQLFDEYTQLPNAIIDGNCVTFYTRSQYEVINDGPMAEQMIEDLMESYGYSQEQAKQFVTNNRHAIIDDMWDAYSKYFDDFAEDLTDD